VTEPIHPASYQELVQLVKLHGADKLIVAIRAIEKQLQPGRIVSIRMPLKD